ncbi:MAG: L-serine ammonia-lyase, iron-sulfur-dependent, subunit alpha [Lachnospiraceae bacterium]|nr:L-serine ammonia-lyase, iron-sulfur-dependent, subunit alpha [Lachnospiraceae bacterium]
MIQKEMSQKTALRKMTQAEMLQILKQELAPALGCTEPVAIAYAAAKARSVLGTMPNHAKILVSRNILKNAMGVGLPGTKVVGLEMAAALGIIGGNSDAILEVLDGVTPDQIQMAEQFAKTGVEVEQKVTSKKLYIEVILKTEEDNASVVIEDSHTNITKITHGAVSIYDRSSCGEIEEAECDKSGLTVDGIYEAVTRMAPEELSFLNETIQMNWAIAQEGLQRRYGLGVGKNIYDSIKTEDKADDMQNYIVALAAAAADVRMAGGTKPVMTICGSGNQGITATLPVIAAVISLKASEEMLCRALALGCLITIHVKQFIGKLSPLCGCGMGSSIGVCCALTYLQGGGLSQIKSAINNMVADVSGIICDGAKAGCALKIATVISSAYQCSLLALKNSGAGELDGIVGADVENSIRNLGELGNRGMADTDRVILDMMVCR